MTDLVGAAEIAGRLGVKQATTIHAWRRRYEDFPSLSPPSVRGSSGRGLMLRPGRRRRGVRL